MTPIAVDFIMRADYQKTRGGDVAQIESSVAGIADKIDARYFAATSGMKLRSRAIQHIVNVDRPLDFLSALDQCGDRVIVSPVHHALPRILAMQQAVGEDRRANFLPFPLRERIAFAVRSSGGRAGDRTPQALARTARIALTPGNMWRRLGRALDGVDHVALLSEQEGQDLMIDTGWRGHNATLIPNGYPQAQSSPPSWSERERGIIVVGRIEPRKRQLAIAEAAVEAGVRVTFVGPVTDDGYGAQFRHLAETQPMIEWLGPQSPARTVVLIATARVLLNASWVEVQSLVDIESATSGCWVVTSPTGSSREWLGPAVDRMNTDDPRALIEQARLRAESATPPPPVTYSHSWEAAGEKLLALYRGMIA